MQPIKRWMATKVVSVRPLDAVDQARKLMQEHRINQLPVVAGDRLVGIVTDRDLRDAYPSVFETARHDMRNEPDEDFDPHHVTVESVMVQEPKTIGAAASVSDAARLMRRERVGALPVVDDQGKLVGLLTRSDVLDAYVALDEQRT